MSNFHGNARNCILSYGTDTADSSAELVAFGSDTYTELGMTNKLKLPVYERGVGRFSVLNEDGKFSLSGNLADMDVSGALVLCDDEAGHAAMFADIDAGNVYRNWKLVTPVGEVHYVKGFTSKWDRAEYDADADPPEPVRVDFNIAVDGKPTVTS